MTNEQAHHIANVTLQLYLSEQAILREEREWLPGHLDNLQKAYRQRTRAQAKLAEAVKELSEDDFLELAPA